MAGLEGSGREKLIGYHGSMLILRVVLHVAFLIFTLGLGVDLALNPAGGTLLWLIPCVVAVGHAVWIVRRLRSRSDQRPRGDA